MRNKKYSEEIAIEFENIEKVLSQLPNYKKLSKLSLLELAGTAAMLHSVYNGVENILKQLFVIKGISIPAGKVWHKDLITVSVKKKIIKESTAELLKEYLAFRHFFVHAYSLDIYSEKMEPLVQNVSSIIAMFKSDITGR